MQNGSESSSQEFVKYSTNPTDCEWYVRIVTIHKKKIDTMDLGMEDE